MFCLLKSSSSNLSKLNDANQTIDQPWKDPKPTLQIRYTLNQP